jgi:hypothetical protein
MYARRQYGIATLVLALAAVGAACDDRDSLPAANLVGPSSTVLGSSISTAAVVTVEPATVHPDVLPGAGCQPSPLFQARFGLVFHSNRDTAVRGVRFDFLDRFGGRHVLTSVPVTSSGNGSVPVPLPTSSPVPIPGTLPFYGVPVPSSSPRTVPFVLQFGCGVFLPGTMFVTVDIGDGRGLSDVARVDFPIG